MTAHKSYLAQALALAKVRRGFCAPNPSVGSVLVKNKKTLSTGYHWGAGYPHAEVEAVKKLSDEAKGATLYVSLEPCCHEGRTPPCTQFIISQGISKVYYSYQDPNPRVAGKGEAILRKAGVSCEQIKSDEADEFYKSYTYWVKTRRPWVTAKIALSLDAKVAGPKGQPIQITGEELKQFTHQWRKQSDAILTSAKTIIHDDPQLNARLNDQIFAKPIYVLDKNLEIPSSAQIFKTAQSITIFYARNSLIEEKVKEKLKTVSKNKIAIRYQPISYRNKKLDLSEIMAFIGEKGIHDIWVEAGGTLFQELILTKLMHRGFIYLGAKYLGASAQSAFSAKENLLARAQDFRWEIAGQDALCEILFNE